MLLLIFEKTGINIGLWIITPLFKLAAFAFKIFMILAQSDALKEIDYGLLLTNFYVVLGLIMLFVMAFALLRGIVNPDDQKQGTTVVKNVIINFVVSCIMLGFLPTIFPFMFDVQDSILRYNVIGGFFGYGDAGSELTQTDNVNEVEASAYRLVNGVFTSFFNVSDSYCTNFLSGGTDNSGDSEKTFKGKREELEACQESLTTDVLYESGKNMGSSFLEYKYYVDRTGQFGVYSNFVDQAADGNVDFDFLILLIAGIALLYVGTSYCFDMGLRLIKLIFYQLIAPIPIFLRVVPNSKLSGTFNQWLKVTLTCWMEVFIRIFIFCFCTWLCSALLNTPFISTTIYGYGRKTGLFTTAFILMAVVMFMKRSPKLLSEITGIDSGNMKLGIREKLAEGGGFVAGAAIGAGASTLAKNASASIQNYRNKFARDENGNVIRNEDRKKMLKNGKAATFGTRFWGAVGGVTSAAAGAASGLVSGGKAAAGSKNEKDMKKAIISGTEKSVGARIKRASYRAARSTGEGGVVGWLKDTGRVIAGHAKDVGRSAYNYVTDQSIEGLNRRSQSMAQVVSAYNTHSDGLESLMAKEQAKGEKSIFNRSEKHGFSEDVYRAYDDYNSTAQNLRDIQRRFQMGTASEKELRDAEGDFAAAKDAMRDQLANLTFKGTNSGDYKALDAKAQAALQDGMVDAERLQTAILTSAGSEPVQKIFGAEGNNVIYKILDKDSYITTDDFEYEDKSTGKKYKFKDLANISKGQSDIRIAEMQKEEAAKGEKKQ